MSNLGKEAATLKWQQGLSWPEVFQQFPTHSSEKVRTAARRYKKRNKQEFDTGPTSGIDFKEDGNTAIATSVSEQVRTLDDLIRVCAIDTDVWVVAEWNVKTFDGWRGNTQKDLTYVDGKMTGKIKDDGIVTKTLYSVTAKLKRKVPIALIPTFSIIRPAIIYEEPAPTDAHTHSTLFFSDTHIGFDKRPSDSLLVPYHDRKAISLVIQIASQLQPQTIILGGDGLDLPQWSKDYAKKPEFFHTTQPALYEMHWVLAALRSVCQKSVIIYLEGNHEARVPRYVQANMIEGYGLSAVDGAAPLLSLRTLLGLDGLQVRWIDGYADGQATYMPWDWIKYQHGSLARAPGTTAKAVMDRSIMWQVFGHIHRCEMASKTYEQGLAASAVSFGCLCNTNGRVPGSSPTSQWQKRFGVIMHAYTPDTVSVDVINVENGRAVYNGACYVGEDYVDELVMQWPEWKWKVPEP